MYFVCYDLDDNLICFLNDINEFHLFTGIRIKDINYRFDSSPNDYIKSIVNDKMYKFYRFQ